MVNEQDTLEDWGVIEPRMQFSLHEAQRSNAALLIVHIALLVAFIFMQVWLMVAVNVVSVAVYAVLFRVLKSSHSDWFVPVLQIEVLLHMVLAVVCLGWDYGFQLYSFSLVATTSYSKYLERAVDVNRSYSLLFVVLVAAAFVGLSIFTRFHGPLYVLDQPDIASGFFVANAIITFSLMIFYLMKFDRAIVHAETSLHALAERDVLTALSNRRSMMEIAQEAFARAESDQVEIAVALIDIDDFKLVNDRYGHDAGDFVLRALGQNMKSLETATVHTGRWGGEEFLTIAEGDHAYLQLRGRLQKLMASTSDLPLNYGRWRIPTSITCGLACRRAGEDFDATVKRADSLMYIGKARGKNCLVDEDNNRSSNPPYSGFDASRG